MAKSKQQKQKDRERRVAKKKLAAAEARRAQQKASPEPKTIAPDKAKIMKAAVPKVDHVPVTKKTPSNQRRGG